MKRIGRRLRRRLSRPVNALDFGADPSGRADSTAAIQAALGKASSRMGWLPNRLWLPWYARRIVAARRTVFLPAGTYSVTTTEVPPGTTLCGDTERQA